MRTLHLNGFSNPACHSISCRASRGLEGAPSTGCRARRERDGAEGAASGAQLTASQGRLVQRAEEGSGAGRARRGRRCPFPCPHRAFSSRGPRHPGSARGTAPRSGAVTGSAVSPPCPSDVIAPAVPEERSICPCFCCHFLFLRGSLRLPARSVSARSHLSPAPPAFPRPP